MWLDCKQGFGHPRAEWGLGDMLDVQQGANMLLHNSALLEMDHIY